MNFYGNFSFCAREINLEPKVKNQSKYEMFLPKPLTLTFVGWRMVRYILWRWKGLMCNVYLPHSEESMVFF